MLLTGSATVIEAAEACGFESASYFSTVFRKKFGVTPIQARNNSKEEI